MFQKEAKKKVSSKQVSNFSLLFNIRKNVKNFAEANFRKMIRKVTWPGVN